jgi:glutathione S-transferase
MKIYLDSVSTTSRPVLLFLAEHDTPAEIVPISLRDDEHLTQEFATLNPNKSVPVLQEKDFVLTECSAILKYLAEKSSSRTYPKDLKARARVNEAMDWFNTGFYRDLGYGVVYPQILPDHAFANPLTQGDVLRRGAERSAARLAVLDGHWLRRADFLCGSEPTIADYLGSCYVAIAEWVGFDITIYGNVQRWISGMKARASREKTHSDWNAMTEVLRAQRRRTPDKSGALDKFL